MKSLESEFKQSFPVYELWDYVDRQLPKWKQDIVYNQLFRRSEWRFAPLTAELQGKLDEES